MRTGPNRDVGHLTCTYDVLHYLVGNLGKAILSQATTQVRLKKEDSAVKTMATATTSVKGPD